MQQSEWIFYHNPRCGKSRTALELLEDRGVEPIVVFYLKTPPNVATLRKLAKQLGLRPGQMVRRHEKIFETLDLDLTDDAAVLKAIAEHPVLLERPIVVHDQKAVIGRPPAKVLTLLPPKREEDFEEAGALD